MFNLNYSGARGFHRFGTKYRLGANGKWPRGTPSYRLMQKSVKQFANLRARPYTAAKPPHTSLYIPRSRTSKSKSKSKLMHIKPKGGIAQVMVKMRII